MKDFSVSLETYLQVNGKEDIPTHNVTHHDHYGYTINGIIIEYCDYEYKNNEDDKIKLDGIKVYNSYSNKTWIVPIFDTKIKLPISMLIDNKRIIRDNKINKII